MSSRPTTSNEVVSRLAVMDITSGTNYFVAELNLSLGVSICLDVVSIETLDLDTEKKSVSTVSKS